MRVLIVALTGARRPQARADVESAISGGHEVHLVVTKAAGWDPPHGVLLHALSETESRHPVLRAERFLVLVLPRWLYTAGRRLLGLLERILPGRLGRRVKRLGGTWKRLWIRTREGTRRFHKERWGRAYGYVRPWFLWRAARRAVVPRLPDPMDVIVVSDSLSTPIGWKLARRWESAAVGFSLAEALEGIDELPVDSGRD